MTHEHFFQCPYCWKRISMLLDSSIPEQHYVEDCENCCNPITVDVKFDGEDLLAFSAEKLGQ